MRGLARGLSVEQQYGLGESFCSWASWSPVDDRPVDEGDLTQNEWRRQTADDCIAAVRAVLDYATARGCTLGGLLPGKNCLEGEARGVSGCKRCIIAGADSRTSQVLDMK